MRGCSKTLDNHNYAVINLHQCYLCMRGISSLGHSHEFTSVRRSRALNRRSMPTWSVYTKASQMDSWLAVGPSRWTLTNAPGMGGLQGRNRGLPSSRCPVNLLQIGFVPKSGRLLPTLTTMVAGWFLPERRRYDQNQSEKGAMNASQLRKLKIERIEIV